MLSEAKRSQQSMLDTDNAVPGYIAGVAKTAAIGLSPGGGAGNLGGDGQGDGRGRGKGKGAKGRGRGNDGGGKGGGKGGNRSPSANQPPPKKQAFDPAVKVPTRITDRSVQLGRSQAHHQTREV